MCSWRREQKPQDGFKPLRGSLYFYCSKLFRDQGPGLRFWARPHLVLAVVVLRVSQDSVAESQHVLEGSVLLVRQLLQTQQGALISSSVLEGGLQDPKDLKNQTGKVTCSALWVISSSDRLGQLVIPGGVMLLSLAASFSLNSCW